VVLVHASEVRRRGVDLQTDVLDAPVLGRVLVQLREAPLDVPQMAAVAEFLLHIGDEVLVVEILAGRLNFTIDNGFVLKLVEVSTLQVWEPGPVIGGGIRLPELLEVLQRMLGTRLEDAFLAGVQVEFKVFYLFLDREDAASIEELRLERSICDFGSGGLIILLPFLILQVYVLLRLDADIKVPKDSHADSLLSWHPISGLLYSQ
jgi:hypothetical protein